MLDPQGTSMPRIFRWLALNLAVTFVYFSLGKLGLAIALPPGFASAIWPAAGMAFAITALWGARQVVLGIFVGSVLTNATVGGGFHVDTVAVLIATGSTVQALVGGFWLNRLIPRLELDRPGRVIQFTMVGVGSSVIAASVGNIVLLAHGFIGASQVFHTFVTWWLGDAFGVQIFAPLTLLILAPNDTWKLRRLSVGLPLLVSFAMCGLVYYFVLVSEERRLLNVFSSEVESFEGELRSLDRIQGQALRQFAASYNLRNEVPGTEFSRLCTALHKSLTGVRAISWAPVLDAAAQQKYPGKILRPPGFAANANGLAAPLTQIYPQTGNEGLDLLGEPRRAQAVLKSLDSMALSMTEPIHLVRESEGPGSILLMAPVNNPKGRGVIVAVMDLRLIDVALKDIPGIAWEMSEITAQGRRLVRQSTPMTMPAFTGTTHLDRRGVYSQQTLQLADRKWHFLLYLPHSRLATQASQAPLLVMLLALFSCGVVSTFALIMSSHRERVEVEVKEKTAALNLEIERRKSDLMALEHAKAAAESANSAKGQFLANMSHEIRTPMNAILGLLNLLQTTELTARQRDYASKTDVAAKSLLVLLNDILDFSKVEAGKMVLDNDAFRLDHMLRKLAVVLSSNVGTRDIEVLFDIDPGIPEVVVGDAMRLQQVLVNLGSNAIKFTSKGQVILSLRKLSGSDDFVTIEFAVQDSGIGIAPEHQSHIFSGFSQAESSTTRRFGGTGLGLAISKRFVELMGGDIHLVSALGTGSTFSFALSLPLPLQVFPGLQSIANSSGPPQHVLVVDDNPIAGALMVRMIQSWGWEADLTDSGAQALDLIQRTHKQSPSTFPFPIIFMDWQMPVMDGWEATKRIRDYVVQHSADQPVIIMVTAHGRETLAHRTVEEQELLSGFLVKPVTASMLFDAIAEARAGDSGIRQFARNQSSRRQLNGMRILVVEDNLINQQVADELLSAEGAIVSLAANGRLGADAVAHAAPQFDVVLMDIQMPILDGYGATKIIREELGLTQLPIVAMTANAMDKDRENCLASGMNEHVSKPFEMAKLVSLLIRLTGLQAASESPFDEDPAPLEGLPQIPGLDIATALNRMSGMRSLYVRTSKDFSKILSTIEQDLRLHIQNNDFKSLLMQLHTLKGNAGTVGAIELANKAAELEKLCKEDGGVGRCSERLSELNVLCVSTRTLLELAIEGLEPTSQTAVEQKSSPMDVKAVLTGLRELEELTGASNLDALSLFADLRDVLIALPSEDFDPLDLALQNFDFEEARKLCKSMVFRYTS